MADPLAPPGNVLELRHHWIVGADLNITTRTHQAYSGTHPSAASLKVIAENLITIFGNRYGHLLNTGYNHSHLTVTDLSSNEGARTEVVGFGTGTHAGATCSAGVCVLVNYLLNVRYRGGKPRSYFPFGSMQDLSSPQTWSQSFLVEVGTGMNLAAQEIGVLNHEGTQLGGMVCVSWFKGFENEPYGQPVKYRQVPKRRIPPAVYGITGIAINPIPGTQRARYRRGG